MSVLRMIMAAVLAMGSFAATPVSAQFFMSSRDFNGTPVRGDEPGIGVEMPGATDAEIRAALVWNLRAALNIAALQCQFEESLLSVPTYNIMLKDHRAELAKSFDTLTKYFQRVNKAGGVRAGQSALDRFGTQIYGSFSTASAQYTFCQTASSVARDAIFTPRGSLYETASLRMRSLRNSLVPYGEQRFPRGMRYDGGTYLPRLDPMCWNKDGSWNPKKCGTNVQWMLRY